MSIESMMRRIESNRIERGFYGSSRSSADDEVARGKVHSSSWSETTPPSDRGGDDALVSLRRQRSRRAGMRAFALLGLVALARAASGAEHVVRASPETTHFGGCVPPATTRVRASHLSAPFEIRRRNAPRARSPTTTRRPLPPPPSSARAGGVPRTRPSRPFEAATSCISGP